jgi:hypothetical protein
LELLKSYFFIIAIDFYKIFNGVLAIIREHAYFEQFFERSTKAGFSVRNQKVYKGLHNYYLVVK